MPSMAASIATGPPLDVLAELAGGPRVDDLVRRAAEVAPDRVALAAANTRITFRELDDQADRAAAGVRRALGETGTVVALAGELDPLFAIGFYGICRSGDTVAIVNPLLREEMLANLLRMCGAVMAIVPPVPHARLMRVLDRLPDLRHVVLMRSGAGDGRTRTFGDLLAHEPGGGARPARPDPDAVACIQFTSGTTGAPKGVRLSHRNLTVNAAQIAHGHQLDGDSVLFNYLPTFHLMHLNAGVGVAARHVLYAGDDAVAAVGAAARSGATHLYSLPVRLARLAVDARLPSAAVPSLRAILSGGSALSASLAGTLSAHFGVPVVQGFGLAETSPATHLGELDRPKPGSSGVLVPGARCRIVDLETGEVVAIGEKGEIQVDGPQLMLGYLGRDLREDVDRDGWFATGDVGYLDRDGHLFVVDRIKDVFKCDNWLVSPSQIEAVLLRHPDVRDCVVLERPDPFRGAVARGLVVAERAGVDVELLRAFVNDQVPYYEQLAAIDLVASIPRSPTGKVSRRDLNQRIRAEKEGA